MPSSSNRDRGGIPFFKGMSCSKTIFIILVMKREGGTDPRKKEKKRKKSRGGRSGQGGGWRLAREIYSRQRALCHHQRSPCVLSTLRYCGRFPLRSEKPKKSRPPVFFRLPLPRTTIRTPLTTPSPTNNHLLPINSLDF